MKSLWASLATFRNKIEVVKKDANNPFFKSKYADLPSILDAIKKPLAESWLAITHNMINSDWWYALVTTVIDIDSWELITSEFPVFWNKPQEVGSSVSYARRYNLQALLDIPTDEDDDGNNANIAPRTKKEYIDTPSGEKKEKPITSPNEFCPECWESCETKKGTTKDWRPYEMGICKNHWEDLRFFVNRKDLSEQSF